MDLTHFNEQGHARMVDVSEKAQTCRVARATVTVQMAAATMERIRAGTNGNGDVLAVAQVAAANWTVTEARATRQVCAF